ncbi:MAG: hypothetical protein KHX03_00120 [Clostridium sp.]|nr:hypothetical protein [Clostridium sp.]
MSEKIIILSGKQYSGKDTVAKILLENLTNFKRIGLGDAIKIEYSEKTGIPFEEIEKNKHLYRQDLINLGNKRRSEDKDYWIKKVIKMPGNIVVPDVRVKRELEFFEEAGAYKIRVEASRETRSSRGNLVGETDITEVDLDNVKSWDYVINNDSTYENLQAESIKLASEIKSFLNKK